MITGVENIIRISLNFLGALQNEIIVLKSWIMEDISGKESTDWSLYNKFAKSLKPGCSKKQRKRLLSENSIPGVKDDEL